MIVDHKKRLELVKTKNLCQKCLKSGHKFADCRSPKGCFSCESKKHHTALCSPDGQEISLIAKSRRAPVVLQTADIKISDLNATKDMDVTVIFDGCSQRTYVTERVIHKLNLLTECRVSIPCS